MKLLKKIFTSKIVLYLVAFVALTNILGYLMKNDIQSLTFFLALGYLSSYFSKNMIINFLVAILGTNVWGGSVREGFDVEDHDKAHREKRKKRKKKAGGSDEDEDTDDEEEGVERRGSEKKEKKESLTNLRPARLRPASGNYEEDEDEDNNVARIDSGANMLATYKQMEDVLGKGGMKNLAKDTRSLVEQQKSLMKQVETMKPMMGQMGAMVKNFGGVDGINKMMKQLKGMGGIQKPHT